MGTKIEYKGPSIHERIITQKDLKDNNDVEFGDYKMKDLVWAPGKARRAVFLDPEMPADVKEQVLDVLKAEKTFTVKDGDDVTEADAKAGEVNPDGSSKATGQGGSPVLTQALGEQAKSTDSVPGDQAGSTTTSTRSSTTGGSTATR